MYEAYYGFAEKPFNLTPDPKYLYHSRRHTEAFAHLEFGRRERGGFIVLTGEVGTGKTTLARYFLGRLPRQHRHRGRALPGPHRGGAAAAPSSTTCTSPWRAAPSRTWWTRSTASS